MLFQLLRVNVEVEVLADLLVAVAEDFCGTTAKSFEAKNPISRTVLLRKLEKSVRNDTFSNYCSIDYDFVFDALRLG